MIASSPTANTGQLAHQEPMRREILIAKLKASGLKVTIPRLALLEVLSDQAQPVTIDQLFARMGKVTCDLVTVYRAMSAFERANVVYRSGFSERGAVLYSVRGSENRTYPVVCKGTSIIDELDRESSAELQIVIEKIKHRLQSRGYVSLEHIVEFFAISSPAGTPGC